MRDKIMEILIDMRPDIDFEKEKNLISDGLLSSFDIVALVAEVENKLGIVISADSLTVNNFDDIDSIVNTVISSQAK